MQLKKYNAYFFFLILACVTVLAYFIAKAFLIPFLIAGILAFMFSPVYDYLLKTVGKKGISSFLSCLIITLIVILPIFIVVSLVVHEIQNIINNISYNSQSIRDTANNFFHNLFALPLAKYLGLEKGVGGDMIAKLVKGASQYALSIFQSVYEGVAHLIFVIFIMFFSLFYLFFDGKKLVQKILDVSPLEEKYNQILIEKFTSIVRATIKGTILIAILQGALGGILFWMTGVSSPILLGMLMAISSVIPSVGSGLVWVPVGVTMLLLGNFTQGMIILIFSAVVISTVDNFARPRLVGKDTQMHPLMILFSTIGGIALFGISGFLIGPIVMSLFVALWDIYALEFSYKSE